MLKAALAAGFLLVLGATSAACSTSTQFLAEGPGSPTDRATGTVPEGSLGVCRIPNTARPIIVDQQVWEHARVCTPRTPPRFVRVGYTPLVVNGTEADAIKEQEAILNEIRAGEADAGGNNRLVALMRTLHDRGLKDPNLRARVSQQTTRDYICDYSYLLNTMAAQRAKLSGGEKCAAKAYDSVIRSESCLFDVAREESVWLTSSWSCVTHTGTVVGSDSSCFRMCAYDDYCAKYVSCATPDVDLTLCALGVCLPEARAGI